MKPAEFAYCAKGGHAKPEAVGFVCKDHVATPGKYTHCANCGGPMPEEGDCYVHDGCLRR